MPVRHVVSASIFTDHSPVLAVGVVQFHHGITEFVNREYARGNVDVFMDMPAK
jgi:hypothetical protein